MMVEVFKTNITNRALANRLVDHIHNTFREYKANFDLEDCDHILRVKCVQGFVQPFLLINFLKEFGCIAQVLPDEVEPPTLLIPTQEYTSKYLS